MDQRRRIAIWRAKTVLTFDDGWVDTVDSIGLQSLPRPLRVDVDQPVAAAYSV